MQDQVRKDERCPVKPGMTTLREQIYLILLPQRSKTATREQNSLFLLQLTLFYHRSNHQPFQWRVSAVGSGASG